MLCDMSEKLNFEFELEETYRATKQDWFSKVLPNS